MNLEEILEKFENIKYESLGFPAVCLIFIDSKWQAFLRNEKSRNENNFIGSSPIEALTKLYDYCSNQKYL